MHEERPDRYIMIGLHKMAAQVGDGLVPEIYELLMSRSRHLEENPNVVEFPAWQARPPVREGFAVAPIAQNNILSFPVAADMPAAQINGR